MSQPQRTDPELLKAVAREARSLMDDRAFVTAVKSLRYQWEGELFNVRLSDRDQIMDLRARLMALDAIPRMLDHLMQSESMGQGRKSNA
jgi:hypothetical protein